jgi:hypothetical protein
MAALSKTYSFTPGTAIVAAQMNENFDDVVDWATGTPTLSTGGSATTVSGSLAVTQAATLSTTLAVTGIATFSDQVYLNGSTQQICYEGSSADAYETFVVATNATADRTITLPDATGTVALTSTTMPLSGGTFTGPVTFDGASPIVLEGATGNAYETTIAVTDPTADRIITVPDTTGTMALTSDITTPVTAVTGTAPIVSSGGYTPAISVTTNDAQLILNNSIFN